MDENRWDGTMLEPVAEINAFMLETLRATAAAEEHSSLRLVSGLRELWRELDAPAQQRLAHCPYLLLDAGFACRERWERPAPERGVMDGGGSHGYFASPRGVALVRRTLVFAWHLARSNRLPARVLLGMSAECAERIAASALRDLEALAELGAAAGHLAADDARGARWPGDAPEAGAVARGAAAGRGSGVVGAALW
jgi:hypothetical protein